MESQPRKRKTTFALDNVVLEDAKAIVDMGNYNSLSAFVETAITELVQRHRKKDIKRSLLEASREPLFLADIEEVQRDFQYADWESLEENS